jgi:hypothetical protein
VGPVGIAVILPGIVGEPLPARYGRRVTVHI